MNECKIGNDGGMFIVWLLCNSFSQCFVHKHWKRKNKNQNVPEPKIISSLVTQKTPPKMFSLLT